MPNYLTIKLKLGFGFCSPKCGLTKCKQEKYNNVTVVRLYMYVGRLASFKEFPGVG